MITSEQLIRARLAILTMAAELKNVARACKLAGVSRSQFYAMKRAYETYGKEGLAPRPRRKPQMPNRTSAVIESHILLITRINPYVSYIKLADLMRHDGAAVTPTMVRYVWQRHGLSTRSARRRWVKKQNGQSALSKSQEATPMSYVTEGARSFGPTSSQLTSAVSCDPVAADENTVASV
jgi:transposase